MRASENRALSRVFGPQKGEVTGGSRKLHSEELHSSHSSPDVTRIMKWAGHEEFVGEVRNAYKVLVGNPEGKRPLGRSRHRWEDYIKMCLKGKGWEPVYQNRDVWRAVVYTVINF
jgi:hypothetical protein